MLATRIPSLNYGSYKAEGVTVNYDSATANIDDITCYDGDADEDTKLLKTRIGMCYDTTSNVNTWYNVCREDIAVDDVKLIVADHARYKYGFEGTIDLCTKHCFIYLRPGEPGAGTATTNQLINYYDLIFLNEFEAHCRDPHQPSEVIVRYNEEYEYYANRGQYFSLRETNDFRITRVELDLNLPYAAGVYSNPTCTVNGDASWTLHYKKDNDN